MTARYKQNDKVFTDFPVVHYMLNEVGYIATDDLSDIKILEPASGEGSFALEIVRRLEQSSKKFKFDFINALNSNLCFIELNIENFNKLKKNIIELLESLGYASMLIDDYIFINSNYLMLESLEKFDCIVGNPPYIRHEIINKDLKVIYRDKFSTFRYRADLYILFYEHSLNLLADKGRVSFICSNRWIYNQYGQKLREKIVENYHLEKLLNIEKTKPFNKQVIAYPVITTIANQKGNKTLFYENNLKEIDFKTIDFELKEMPKDVHWQNLFLDYSLEDSSLKSIEEQGFTIGIGVATGADDIFIIKKSQETEIEDSRLLPLLKSNGLKEEKIKWDGSFILNPFNENELCNLDNYPKLKDYFDKHEKRLKQRYIAKKRPMQWYKTIDKIKIDLLDKPKLLLPDLATVKFLHIDRGDYYPHHNLYYIIHKDIDKLKLLATILMSDFIKEQLSKIGIKMNGGLPRFQSQTLKKLRIPNIEAFPIFEQDSLIEAYEKKDFAVMNRLIRAKCQK
ncbi:MAG: Eco57I restriction-modification methylase domain-containing protein [Campylobacterota bacterium]|nr:Eco57I restriction-modification methylase domain-containing protein [Campylobacterota bacterium]